MEEEQTVEEALKHLFLEGFISISCTDETGVGYMPTPKGMEAVKAMK